VSRDKPAPDLFLHAAQQVGVAPEACAVVEDSPSGVEAAIAAGMRAFAYSGGQCRLRRLRLNGVEVFEDMHLLPDLLFPAAFRN
jgi:beta-phosphoglucomutase-like phosphatase (HAD superfamily)